MSIKKIWKEASQFLFWFDKKATVNRVAVLRASVEFSEDGETWFEGEDPVAQIWAIGNDSLPLVRVRVSVEGGGIVP